MICVSIVETGLEACKKAIAGLELAELRLDKTNLSESDLQSLLKAKGKTKIIATCRPTTQTTSGTSANSLSDEARKALLLHAINCGVDLVDIEVESTDSFKQDVVQAAKAKGCRVIVSYHNYEKTPRREELKQTIEWCFESGATIAKIACMATSVKDS
ncbi:type I 3-dehydroquinate dehydratase, partial [Candidatus Micrarchaeota archaeon]|nr:type I 3-dehydroquinate dehydratase [Candidatus Micrarchaeota archaeon]